MIYFSLSFILGIIYGYFLEYFAHRYIFHNYKSFKFAFKRHFKEHHKNSRRNNMIDEGYLGIVSRANVFEIISLSSALIIHIPIYFISPGFYFALIFSVAQYFYVHKRMHTNSEWGKEHYPWHYKHHMGSQNKNFGVRSDFVDRIMGTN